MAAGSHTVASYETPVGGNPNRGQAIAMVAPAGGPGRIPNHAPTSSQSRSGPAAAGGPPLPGTDWFSWTQQRLRELGATYYLLETWGRNGELYRFHCKMAIAGNQDYNRHFEATDSDAARAMQAVLRQVEAWRAGQEP